MSKPSPTAKAAAKAKLVRERKVVARFVFWSAIAGRIVCLALLIYAGNESRFHIQEVALWGGLEAREAAGLFLLIDVFSAVGKWFSLPLFVAKTRRKGYIVYAVGGGVSLAFNVGAGLIVENWGRAAYGAGLIGFVAALEWLGFDVKGKAVRIPNDDVKPETAAAATPPAASTAPSQPAAPSRRCAPGCTCARHRARTGRGIPQPPAAAPVSPAHASLVAQPDGGLLVPDLATVRQVAGVR